MRRARAARAILAGMLVCLAWLVLPAGARAASGPRTAAPGGGPSAAAATAAGHPADAPAASGPAPATQSSPAAPAAGTVVLWGEAGLSAAQARQLQRIALAARRWRAALPGLAAAARQQGDSALLDELAKLDTLLQQVAATQRLTLAAYLAAMSASDQALSLWAADAAALAPGEQQAGQQADFGAADLTTAADTGFVFSADLGAGTTWTYAEGPPPGDAGAAAGRMGADGTGAGDGGPSDAGGSAAGTDGGRDAAGIDPGAAAGGAGAAVGAEAGAAGSGWVVIRGGPDSSWQPEASASSTAALMLAPQAGEARDGNLAPADAAVALDGDPAAGAPAAFDWEEICRPWQPDTGTASVCPVSTLPPPGASAP